MAKVEINEYTPAGMVFMGGILTAIVGLSNLLTGADRNRFVPRGYPLWYDDPIKKKERCL